MSEETTAKRPSPRLKRPRPHTSCQLPLGERLYTEPKLGCEWVPRPHSRPTLAIASNGSVWHWNCGWVCMHRPKGSNFYEPKPNSKPLGHLRFRGAVQLLIKTKPEERQVLLGVEKPGQPWRRYVGGALYEHFLYGNVKIRATDGMRAVVEEADGMMLNVMFDNLTEIKPFPELRKPKADSKEKKPKVDKDAKMREDAARLAALLMDL